MFTINYIFIGSDKKLQHYGLFQKKWFTDVSLKLEPVLVYKPDHINFDDDIVTNCFYVYSYKSPTIKILFWGAYCLNGYILGLFMQLCY